MINEALLPPPADELNQFTRALIEVIALKGHALVETRDGTILKVGYSPASPGNECNTFYSLNPEHGYCFDADGSARNSSRSDLIELLNG